MKLPDKNNDEIKAEVERSLRNDRSYRLTVGSLPYLRVMTLFVAGVMGLFATVTAALGLKLFHVLPQVGVTCFVTSFICGIIALIAKKKSGF